MSLDLDDRQRAILQEMGVRVWLPEPVVEQPVELAAPVRVAPVPAPRPAAPVMPGAGQPASATAIENVAIDAISAGAAAAKALNRPVPVKTTPVVTSDAGLADGIAAMDWPTLAQTVAECQACKLCTGRRAPVFGVAGALQQADWLVLGEPPDEAEERAGAAFVDQAGQLLDNMLKAVGVRRFAADGAAANPATAAYVTNAVKCRPALVRNPSPQELATCEHYLRREVALVQPKVILAMGRFAALTLLQVSQPELAGTPLGKLRGPIYRYQGIPVVVSYPPSYLLRTPQDKARAWADLCLALDVVRGAA